jgi:hypothetical protein
VISAGPLRYKRSFSHKGIDIDYTHAYTNLQFNVSEAAARSSGFVDGEDRLEGHILRGMGVKLAMFCPGSDSWLRDLQDRMSR